MEKKVRILQFTFLCKEARGIKTLLNVSSGTPFSHEYAKKITSIMLLIKSSNGKQSLREINSFIYHFGVFDWQIIKTYATLFTKT